MPRQTASKFCFGVFHNKYAPPICHSTHPVRAWRGLHRCGREELPLLTGSSDLEEGSRLLAEQGISLVLVTLGGAGSFCRWQGESFTVPGVSVVVAHQHPCQMGGPGGKDGSAAGDPPGQADRSEVEKSAPANGS